MMKIICILSILVLLGAAIPVVNALNLNNEIVDETKVKLNEDYEFCAGKMSIDPGSFPMYSPDVDVELNKDFPGTKRIERGSEIKIYSEWKIKDDTAAFRNERWFFIMAIDVKQYDPVWGYIWCVLDNEILEKDDVVGSSDAGSGKLIYTLPKKLSTKAWFQNGGIVELRVHLKAYYLRDNDEWGEVKLTGILKLKLTGNNPPNKPAKPDGPTQIDISDIKSGNIKYKTSTIDKDNDKIKYGWDFNGDMEVDKWTDFHKSGELVTVTFPKYMTGTSWTIRVIAKDKYFGDLSEWSDPLSVSLPRNKDNQKQMLPTFKYFNLLLQRFQILSKNIIST